jgi:hypothetical protein
MKNKILLTLVFVIVNIMMLLTHKFLFEINVKFGLITMVLHVLFMYVFPYDKVIKD